MRSHVGLVIIVVSMGACIFKAEDDGQNPFTVSTAPGAGDGTACGNGVAEPDQEEDCDGGDFAGVTCETFDFVEPAGLKCDATCRFDTSNCATTCDGNQLEPREACDGLHLGGKTCLDFGFKEPGGLACGDSCTTLDISGCHGVCGNGTVEPDEQCEGMEPQKTCVHCHYPPVINELYYDGAESVDENETGCFIELKGPPLLDLAGYSLAFIGGSDGEAYRVPLPLNGKTSTSGYFVVSQAQPGTQISAAANLRNGPDNLFLLYGDLLVEAVGYGFQSAGGFFRGEGLPAPDAEQGTSLSRSPEGTDTDDNKADFHATPSRTPGAQNR